MKIKEQLFEFLKDQKVTWSTKKKFNPLFKNTSIFYEKCKYNKNTKLMKENGKMR